MPNIGVYGASYIIYFLSSFLALSIANKKKHFLFAGLLSLIIFLPYQKNNYETSEESLNLSIIQPSLDPFEKYKSGSNKSIEDVLVNIKLVGHILSLRKNISFLSATQASEGIEIAKSEMPDLILMDLRLPDMDGITAFKKLQSINEVKNIPVIALTANAMEGEAEKALGLGFEDYITKPFDIKIFLKAIDKFLV